MAEETKVEDTEQESPTVEDTQTDTEVEKTAEKPEETQETKESATNEDRNWRAVRDELETLKAENKRLKGLDKPQIEVAKESPVTKPYLSQEEYNYLSLEEFKALQAVPELSEETDSYDPLFDAATVGRYRAALDDYARAKLVGEAKQLPSAVKIAKQLKKEWDIKLGSLSEKAKADITEKEIQAKAKKEATVETENTNVRANTGTQDLEDLKIKTRQGDPNAIVERLARSKL